jgi:hypothetical protein
MAKNGKNKKMNEISIFDKKNDTDKKIKIMLMIM